MARRSVAKVDGEGVTVQLPARYHETVRGADRDVQSGRAKELGYYSPEQAVLPRAAVSKMFKEGVIVDVVR